MREISTPRGRAAKCLKAVFAALLTVIAIGTFGVSNASAEQNLKLSFNDGWIALDALTEMAGGFHAIDPEAQDPIVVNIDGSLDNDGNFAAPKEGFNFPDQQLDLGGIALGLQIKAIDDINGTYDRSSGQFDALLPLSLKISVAALGMACEVSPLNLPVSTTGSKDFGKTSEPNVKSAAAFLTGAGAVLGNWSGVSVDDIKDADGTPAGQCGTVLGSLLAGQSFDGSIWLSGTSEVTGTQDCPAGQTGNYPDCRKPAAKIGSVKVTRTTIKAGKKGKIKVTVKNTGNAAFNGKVTLKSNRKSVKVPKSVKVKVAAGKSKTVTVKVRTTRKAKGKATITARAGGKTGKGKVTVKAARKARR